ncbi:MAG: hypothetical protein M1813_003937 [Trichoglossum hirsutum]|nr:MAG: hypothetical protein M1813_003937 [Trichoglossum hirsutum]
MNATEVSDGNAPPSTLRSKLPGNKDHSEPTEDEVKNTSNEPNPTKAPDGLVNGVVSEQILEDDLSGDQSETSLEMREINEFEPLEVRKKKGRKRFLQTTDYIRLIEDRISFLEEEIRGLKGPPLVYESGGSQVDSFGPGARALPQAFAAPPPPLPPLLPLSHPLPDPNRGDGPLRELTYNTWESFQSPATRTSVVEVLVGEPGIPKVKKEGNPEVTKETIAKPAETKMKLPNRIRIHSPHILKLLEKVSSVDFGHGEMAVFLRPFKILVYCEESIRDEIRALEVDVRAAKEEEDKDKGAHNGVEGGAKPEVDGQIERPAIVRHEYQPGTADGPSEDNTPPRLNIDMAEALAHARILEQFMDKELKCILDLRLRIRNGNIKTISFDNLWLLFNPGVVVYSREQAYKVLSTSGCQRLDKRKVQQYRKVVRMDYDGQQPYREHETVSPFVVDCYYIGFNGRKYGAVQKVFRISAYDGERPITTLPICPAKFISKDRREREYERGKLFLSLTGGGAAFKHRQYDGLVVTPDGEIEEVNSRVIIDFVTAFRMQPKWCPDLGLKGASVVDPREVTFCDDTDHEDPLLCFYCWFDNIWEDHRLEQQHASEYMEKLDIKLESLQNASDFEEDQIFLLPEKIYGFILRNRKWVAFTIDDIRDVIPTEENFKDLVIPPRHKRIVEALVKTHSRGSRAVDKGILQRGNIKHHVDFVRGKGEGVIMLLHGPPGVGKTSTAECVAELCDRPLFQITCGDIGTEPEDVEKNLNANFRLAHRWGCVLLLDEADVYLTKRGHEDLKRNTLVSVFLRVLEYYPGILLLTTNRVGLFDEAFKSRIHVSLQYPKLDKVSAMRVWENHIRRAKRRYHVEEKKVMKLARQTFDTMSWNGRQIKNAFQVVISLAEFDALKNPRPIETSETAEPEKVELRLKWFKKVMDASTDFNEYIQKLYGNTEEDRAMTSKHRNDRFESFTFEQNEPPAKQAPPQRTASSDSDSDSDSDDSSSDSDSDVGPQKPKKIKNPVKSKKPKQSRSKTSVTKTSKKKGKKEKVVSESEESSTEEDSSSGESDAEEKADGVGEESEEEAKEEKPPRKKSSRKSKK